MRNICWDPDTSDEVDEIEASALPHVLWGLQGSPFVYCGASGLSGLDHATISSESGMYTNLSCSL